MHILAAALGLSAVLATSATAFLIVKLIGAAYLLYVGLGLLLSKKKASEDGEQTSENQFSFGWGLVKALETAIAVAQCGAEVTVSYRKNEFTRPKPENQENLTRLAADPMADVSVEHPSSERVTTASGAFMGDRKAGKIHLALPSEVREIRADSVVLEKDGAPVTLPNDVVFSMIGREAPLEFFRRLPPRFCRF